MNSAEGTRSTRSTEAFEFRHDEGWRWRVFSEAGSEFAERRLAFKSWTDVGEALNLVQEYVSAAWAMVAW